MCSLTRRNSPNRPQRRPSLRPSRRAALRAHGFRGRLAPVRGKFYPGWPKRAEVLVKCGLADLYPVICLSPWWPRICLLRNQLALVLRWSRSGGSSPGATLMIMKPETFVKWHRTGFRAFWRWKSRSRRSPHSALGPGISEAFQAKVQTGPHRHNLPAGYRVRSTPVLGEFTS